MNAKPNTIQSIKFNNGILDGAVTIQFSSVDNRLEIDIPCDNQQTCNRIYIEHDCQDNTFLAYTHNNEVDLQF